MNAAPSVLITSWIVSLTKVVESYITVACRPDGNRARSRSSVCVTAVAACTALAPGAR